MIGMGTFGPKRGWVSLMRNTVDNQTLEVESANSRLWSAPAPAASWIVAQACLRDHNERRHQRGLALREALRAIDDAHPGPLEARDARALLDLAALGRAKPPTLRTIQMHLKHTRAERLNLESNQRTEQ